ncbi:MAG TPA: hemolysin family protein [Holophagaceae bacterium]|nr:hemolysin family protein [Holophagaceae bacterium]
MTDPSSSSSPVFWTAAALVLLALYRALLACLLAAYNALPSLQRRVLLEEEAFRHPRLADLLGQPRILGMSLRLWNVLLLALLFLAAWPVADAWPGRLWILGAVTAAYLYLFDLALPALLVAGDPAGWLDRLFPWFDLPQRLLAPLVNPVAAAVTRRHEAQERADGDDDEDPTEEAVTALLEEGEAEGILEADDRELIRNVVSLGDTVVRELMTPRTAMRALPVEASLDEAWEAFRACGRSRLPLYEERLDKVVGVLRLKDLLGLPDHATTPLRQLMKPPLFVPESKPAGEVLREMQRARIGLAVVVDEFGGVAGLVTLGDLLDEVFGEIPEEPGGAPEVQILGEGLWLVSGQAHVEDVASALDLDWQRDGFDTVGGLVMARLGRVPRVRDSLVEDGSRITVLRMDGPKVAQVRVERLAKDPKA